MLKRDIRDKREKLFQASKQLRKLGSDEELTYDESLKVRAEQRQKYKKFSFYDNFIKASDKVKKGDK